MYLESLTCVPHNICSTYLHLLRTTYHVRFTYGRPTGLCSSVCHCTLFEPYDVIAYQMNSAYNVSQHHEFNRGWTPVRSAEKLTAIVSRECFRVWRVLLSADIRSASRLLQPFHNTWVSLCIGYVLDGTLLPNQVTLVTTGQEANTGDSVPH